MSTELVPTASFRTRWSTQHVYKYRVLLWSLSQEILLRVVSSVSGLSHFMSAPSLDTWTQRSLHTALCVQCARRFAQRPLIKAAKMTGICHNKRWATHSHTAQQTLVCEGWKMEMKYPGEGRLGKLPHHCHIVRKHPPPPPPNQTFRRGCVIFPWDGTSESFSLGTLCTEIMKNDSSCSVNQMPHLWATDRSKHKPMSMGSFFFFFFEKGVQLYIDYVGNIFDRWDTPVSSQGGMRHSGCHWRGMSGGNATPIWQKCLFPWSCHYDLPAATTFRRESKIRLLSPILNIHRFLEVSLPVRTCLSFSLFPNEALIWSTLRFASLFVIASN